MADAVLVPYADAMLLPLPDEVDPALACGVADNISDGWRAVGPALAARPNGTVLVAGALAPGSIGLYAAGIARALGASRVVYADRDATRLAIAARIGAEPVAVAGADELARLGARFDVTVDASGDPAVLRALLERTGPAGYCTSTAGMFYRRDVVPFPVSDMYRNSITFATGWVHTRAIAHEPLELIRSGRFDPSPVTTAVVAWDDAGDALLEPYTKLIFRRDA